MTDASANPARPVATEPTDAATALRSYLNGRDVDCPACGYNVRDLVGERCPECGEGLMVSLRLQEPRQGALIAGLVGLSAGAGLGGLLLIYWVLMVFVRRVGVPFRWWDPFVITNALGFLAHALAIWLWVRNWHRIRRAPPPVRRLLVLICFAMPLAFIVIFSLAIR